MVVQSRQNVKPVCVKRVKTKFRLMRPKFGPKKGLFKARKRLRNGRIRRALRDLLGLRKSRPWVLTTLYIKQPLTLGWLGPAVPEAFLSQKTLNLVTRPSAIAILGKETAQKRSDTKSLKKFTEAEEVETLGSYDSIYKITLNVGLVRSSRS